jgi:hypothetical protein
MALSALPMGAGRVCDPLSNTRRAKGRVTDPPYWGRGGADTMNFPASASLKCRRHIAM